MRLVIEGPPRTKKNSQRIAVNRRTGARFIRQSATANAWEQVAVLQLRTQLRRLPQFAAYGEGVHLPIFAAPVNLRALIYRERAGRADLLNYLAAVSDALEAAGVLANDELVAGVDGSRLFVDRHCPRVEIEVTPL